MQGALHVYDEETGCVMFCSGSSEGRSGVVLFVHGIGEGLLAVPYLTLLGAELGKCGWALAQVQLRSAFRGYGVGSLAEDAEDVRAAARFATATLGFARAVVLGHSTGAQDAVAAASLPDCPIHGIILQGGVSDREAMLMESEGDTRRWLAAAADMVAQGHGDRLLPAEAYDAPVTASRYASLAGRMTADDMFSSDLSEEELARQLGHVAVPTLVLYSERDQYVPGDVDKRALVDRVCGAVAAEATGVVVEGANHEVAEEAAQARLAAHIVAWLASLDGNTPAGDAGGGGGGR